jgi:hypothetical protein
MERTIDSQRIGYLVQAYSRSLRGIISARSDVQDGLNHTRQELLKLSSRYSRDILYHLSHHFIRVLFEKLNFKPNFSEKQLISVPERFDSPLFPRVITVATSFEGYFVGQLMSEIDLAPLERNESATTSLSTFVTLPHSLLQNWYSISIQEKLPWRVALVYLAAKIAINRHEGATEKQVCGYSGLSQKTVRRHLNILRANDLLLLHEIILKEKTKQLFLYQEPPYMDRLAPIPSFNVNLRDNNPWFAELEPFQGMDDLAWVPFAPWKPKNYDSPLFQVFHDRIDSHERSLVAVLIVAACFTKKQINLWLIETHGSHYGSIIPAIKKLFFTQIEKRFSIPERKHGHYLQISKALPIVMYAARREFQVDILQMVKMAKHTHSEIKLLWHNFTVAWESLQLQAGLLGSTRHLNWNAKYFLTCFLRNHPFHHWVKRYPDSYPKIPLTHSLLGGDVKWVTLSEKDFTIDFLENLSQRSALADVLVPIIRQFNDRKMLRRLRKNTYAANSITPRGVTKTFDNASHRMYVVQASRQAISKRLRSIFLARPGHQFIMFDIKQNDLQLWQALLPQMSNVNPANYKPIIFEEMSKLLDIPRDSVKHAIYHYFYGASKSRIMTEFGLTQQQWLQLDRNIFNRFRPMKRAIVEHTNQKGFTPPTPLGYRIPVNRKRYRAPSLYIQAVGAEIFRAWLLQLHKKDLTSYIVNLIHDEIVLEVPVSLNLYHLTEDVQSALDLAKQKLLPEANLNIRSKSARRWDSDAAVIIKI